MIELNAFDNIARITGQAHQPEEARPGVISAPDVFAAYENRTIELYEMQIRATELSINAAHQKITESMMSPPVDACFADIEVQLMAITEENTSAGDHQTAMDNIRWYIGQTGFIDPKVEETARQSLRWVVESKVCEVYLQERYSRILK